MGSIEKYGKRRQITFRIGPIAQDRLERAAELFDMKPGQYAKALLYKDLGVFNEPLDRRKHSWRQKKRKKKNCCARILDNDWG